MPRSKWRDEFYVRAYQLAAQGLSNRAIGGALGCDKPATFRKWATQRPALRAAIREGRARNGRNFADFVYDRLPTKLRRVWDRLNGLDMHGVCTPEAIEEVFAGQGVRVRQQLFLHAFTHNRFNPTAACRMVGIARNTLSRWIAGDPEFAELYQEINWHKKNWLEDHLFQLVSLGDTAATVFANRTQNRDRGYDTRQTVEITGSVVHSHNLLDMDSLDLPHDVRLAILDAVRRKQAGDMAALPAPVDAAPPTALDPGVVTVRGFEDPAEAA